MQIFKCFNLNLDCNRQSALKKCYNGSFAFFRRLLFRAQVSLWNLNIKELWPVFEVGGVI